MNTSLRSVAALVAVSACVASGSAAAGNYSAVYAFGDSLSDTGRIAALTGGEFPGPATGYASGRFSNGLVAVERLTLQQTGAALTLDHNYAHGGALTGVSPYSGIDSNYAEFNGTGLLNQTAMFRADAGSGNADPDALYFVWAGANDFSEVPVLTNADGTQWNRVIGNIETAIGNLAADGARHFYVPSMPNLGLTPRGLAGGPGNVAAVSSLTAGYNVLLDQRLSSLDAADDAIDIIQFDVHAFMTGIARTVTINGDFLGIENVTTPCQFNPACLDADQYFYWDDIHPTTRAHELLAAALMPVIPEPGSSGMLLVGLGALGWVLRRRAHGQAA